MLGTFCRNVLEDIIIWTECRSCCQQSIKIFLRPSRHFLSNICHFVNHPTIRCFHSGILKSSQNITRRKT